MISTRWIFGRFQESEGANVFRMVVKPFLLPPALPWQIRPNSVKTFSQPQPLAPEPPQLPASSAVFTFPIKASPLDYRRMLHPN